MCSLFHLWLNFLQENLIRDDNKLVLLASLSDSLEYVADSIERQLFLSCCAHKFVFIVAFGIYEHIFHFCKKSWYVAVLYEIHFFFHFTHA